MLEYTSKVTRKCRKASFPPINEVLTLLSFITTFHQWIKEFLFFAFYFSRNQNVFSLIL